MVWSGVDLKMAKTLLSFHFNTARSYTGQVNVVRVRGVNDVKSLAYWAWRPTKPNGASLAFKRHNYIDTRGRSKASHNMMIKDDVKRFTFEVENYYCQANVNAVEMTWTSKLQLTQKEDEIFISQDKYVAEILKKFNYSDVKSASTPVDLEKPLVKDGDADDVDIHLYRSIIRDSPFELVAYTDSDYARSTQDRKSTTGGC
ncbi:hypothetical protein Tco_1294752 [Tanacetum coccineum]